MFKNLTPRQIAIYSAMVITAFMLIIWSVLTALLNSDSWTFRSMLLLVFLVVVSYLVNLFFLKKYIFRKIKLIYKSIHSLKLDPRIKQKQIASDDHIIEDVEKEVSLWADDRVKEIEHLKTLETYRREFLGNVSHELKTPIFSIQGYVHTLIDGGINDDSINLKYLDRTSKNVDRLITIVEDLETISSLESGSLSIDKRQFEIKELVSEVFEAHELMSQEMGINLIFKESAAHPFHVSADREYIRRVLDNLIINSIKYGKQGGTTKVSFYDMHKYILVEVADDGLGISEEHLKHVFDRFYRVDKSRSREAGGSGLGLSIVKHIMDAHGQTINVRSSPGLGSTFGFTLAKA